MHFLSDALIALVVTLLLAVPLTTVLLGWRHSRTSGVWPIAAFIFAALFLATWAGGAWMRPHASDMVGMGLFWLPFVIIGLLLTLLIAAILPRHQQSDSERREQEERIDMTHSIAKGIGAVVLIALVLLILVRYIV